MYPSVGANPKSLRQSICHKRALVALESGRRLGNYEIVEVLGVGGLGEIYRSWDTKLRDLGSNDGCALAPEGGQLVSTVVDTFR